MEEAIEGEEGEVQIALPPQAIQIQSPTSQLNYQTLVMDEENDEETGVSEEEVEV